MKKHQLSAVAVSYWLKTVSEKSDSSPEKIKLQHQSYFLLLSGKILENCFAIAPKKDQSTISQILLTLKFKLFIGFYSFLKEEELTKLQPYSSFRFSLETIKIIEKLPAYAKSITHSFFDLQKAVFQALNALDFSFIEQTLKNQGWFSQNVGEIPQIRYFSLF